MAKIRACKLVGKSEDELNKQLGELKTELSNLRLYHVTRGAPSKLGKIRVLRKSIARIYTVINQARKLHQREIFSSRRWVPKDLRPKKTRAIRRRLSRKERRMKTPRAHRLASAFPRRIYALKR